MSRGRLPIRRLPPSTLAGVASRDAIAQARPHARERGSLGRIPMIRSVSHRSVRSSSPQPPASAGRNRLLSKVDEPRVAECCAIISTLGPARHNQGPVSDKSVQWRRVNRDPSGCPIHDMSVQPLVVLSSLVVHTYEAALRRQPRDEDGHTKRKYGDDGNDRGEYICWWCITWGITK